MPIPAGTGHTQAIGAEPRILIHMGTIAYFADRAGSYLGINYRGQVRAVADLQTEWAAGDLGLTSSLTVEIFDDDKFLLDISHQVQLELTPCEIYHHFVGDAGKMLYFKGIITSPVEWEESGRVLKFDVLNKISGTPLGFAPTKEDIPSLADEAVGQVWPMVFGKPKRSKAVLMSRDPVGSLRYATPTDSESFQVENGNAFPQNRDTIASGIVTPAEPLEVDLKIGDEVVRGYFREDTFHVKEYAYNYKESPFAIEYPQWVEHDGWNFDAYGPVRVASQQQYINETAPKMLKASAPNIVFIPKVDGEGREIDVNGMVLYIKNTERPGEVWAWAKVKTVDQADVYDPNQKLVLDGNLPRVLKGNDEVYFCARRRRGWMNRNEEPYVHEAGSTVRIWKSADPDAVKTQYVCNAFPTIAVTAVYAKYTVKNSNTGASTPKLVRLNPNTYEVEITATDLGINWPGGNQGPIYPCLIKFDDPPVKFMDNINDPLYVDIESGVPNSMGNALQWLLDDWGGLSINHASFGQANEKTRYTETNFTVIDVIDVLELAKDLAWQVRSTLVVKLGEIFMKYMPVASISDLVTRPANNTVLEEETGTIRHVEMGDLITQYSAMYTLRGDQESDEDKYKMVINNNVERYGVQNEDVEIFVYDKRDYVQQTLEWWLKQRSIIWKIFSGRAFLDLLEIDPLDWVLIVSDLLPSGLAGQTPGRIDRMSFSAQEDYIEFEATTAIASGSSNFDPTVLSDTIEEEVSTDPVDADDPPGYAGRVHKDQQQANDDSRPDTEGRSYMTFGRIKSATPTAEGKYECIIYEGGKPEDMDDDTKGTYYVSDAHQRIVPLTVIGGMRPQEDEHIVVRVTPTGYFYHKPIPTYL